MFYLKLILDDRIPFYFSKGKKDIIFLCLHGAGMSGVSFARMAHKAKHFASVASFDFQGHHLSDMRGKWQDQKVYFRRFQCC